jgi:hypothetical protein
MSMPRRFIPFITALAGILVLALPAAAQSQTVTIAPASGSQADTFTVACVCGMVPGLALDVRFVSPEGDASSTAALDQAVAVGGDGNFEFNFVPASEFAGNQMLGIWKVQACVSGTDDCAQQVTFQINE